MSLSVFSVIMAVLWFDVFILLSSGIRRKTAFLLQYSLLPLIILIIASIIRIILPIEMPFATVVPSYRFMPALQRALYYKVSFGTEIQISLGWIIVFMCSLVSTFLLFRLFFKIHQGNLFISALYTEEDARAKRILYEIIDQTSSGQNCTLHIASDIASPIVTGFFHPIILMPENTKLLSDKQLQYILRHEWGHYLSKDLWVKLLIHVLCCVMWWNPPVYLLKRNLDQILELNCDHRVTRKIQQRERLEYLETMIHVLKQYYGKEDRMMEAGAFVSFVSIGKGDTTRQRFQMVYEHQKSIANWKTNLIWILMMGILFILSFSFVVQPHTPPPDLGPGEIEIKVSSKNAYLELNESGTYSFYLNGKYIEVISKDMLKSEPFRSLPVINDD